MRNAFISRLTALAKRDKDVYLLTADTGFKVFDEFQKLFPGRYFNMGISEAGMVGIASGLALSGKKVFLYAIVPFITMRCFEQIRIDLCYQNLSVKLIGVGGGLTYGSAGATHHSIEDIAIMRALPNMTVICPGDPAEVENTIDASMGIGGPCYIRIGKTGERRVHRGRIEFEIGRGIVLYEGKEIAILATGNMLETACDVKNMLEGEDVAAKVVSIHTIKPIDREIIKDIASECKNIVTLEEHNVIGGLGSAVAEVVAEECLNVKLTKFGIPDRYVSASGDQAYQRKAFGLTAEQIVETITGLSKR